MKPLDSILRYVLPRANHCPEPIAIDAIRTAAITFCERTKIWRDTDRFKVSGKCSDIVCAPYGAVLHQIESARFDGRPLEAVSVSWLDENRPGWRTETATLGRYITQLAPGTVRVVPAAAGTLELTTLLKPSEEAEELPDFLIDLYARVLADGALAEILAIPGQLFTSVDLAAYHAGRFERELDRLASQHVRGQQRAPVRITPQFF